MMRRYGTALARAAGRGGGWVWLLLTLVGLPLRGAEQRVIYSTGFEPSEGFSPDLTLIGQPSQGSWVGYGSGGNGMVTNFFAGLGQHAFIGFTAPTNNGDFLNVWRPLNYIPGSTNPPQVRFTVQMSVEDSTTVTNRDDFRWSVYNTRGDRLFSLDFDNDALRISTLLDDNQYRDTGFSFTNAVQYQLQIDMNFASNRWSAALGNVMVVTNQAITTTNRVLDLGDIDAVWAIRKPGSPGDNYLVFDDFRVVAISGSVTNPAPRVGVVEVLSSGALVRAEGTPGSRYVLESTADLRTWGGIKTNTMPVDGYFEHLDRGSGVLRFYRVVER